jgi:hypothetical protein
MTDEVVERLRALPPDLADPGDRFDRVRARVLRRRRLAVAASAAAVVVTAAVVPLGLALANGGPHRGVAPATRAGTLSCPQTFAGTAPWVPRLPDGVDGQSRLVPAQPPQRALVCAYDGANTAAEQNGWALSGSRLLFAGLDRLAADLTWLPRKLPGQENMCTAIGGTQVNYLVGLTYPEGTLWVSTAKEPNDCVDTSNGEFTSQVTIGGQVAASYTAGAWVAAPPPQLTRTDHDPCRGERTGRLGQETAMVPGNPISVQVCEGTPTGQDVSYRTVTVRVGYSDLVAALNALPTQTSSSSCQGDGKQRVFYELLFRYPVGPAVLVWIDPHCDPSIDNRSLQARDASTVVPHIRSLLAGGS